MAHSKQALKRMVQNEKRRIANKGVRSALRTQIRRFEKALEAGDSTAAEAEYRLVTKRLDKAAKTNLVHKKTCSRNKSRMALRLNAVKAKAQNASAP
jgi:small subunit ribosomal protein S20